PALEAVARVEPRAAVRATLEAAARAEGRPPPALGRWRRTLYVHIATAPGLVAVAPHLAVDVLLPDGRWLRELSLTGGEVVVPDLGAGEAEVQVRLGP
ncbi:MAG TPA: hypothetical protein RMH99_26055, partial [Sandaracinaceae bacterium LLY-WYZ-13_1]|nr:hypothetical protein [Sandaracinaceae bacterium LLY-WYZ-13_1]